MNRKKIFLILIVALISVLACSALVACGEDTSGGTGNMEEVSVIKDVDGILKTVGVIYLDGTTLAGYKADKELAKYFDDVSIPTKATKIGTGAFSGCTSLTTITIPASVTEIADSAFLSCAKLQSVTIPASVTAIGKEVFSGCASLTSIALPRTVRTISASLFSGCASLVDFSLNDNVTSIGTYAFSGCKSLKEIVIPEATTNISDGAFNACDGLVIYASATSRPAFWNSAWNGNRPVYWAVYAGDVIRVDGASYVVRNATATLTKITDEAERTSFTLPKTVKDIRNNDFSVTAIGDYAFFATSFSTVIFPKDNGVSLVTSIGASAFRDSALISIELPTGISVISANMLSGCTKLESLTVPSGIDAFGASALSGTTSLASLTIPFVGSARTAVTDTHFGYLFGASSPASNKNAVPAKLASVTVTGGDKLFAYAFQGCSNIKTLKIPNTVSSIGASALSGCTSLTTLEIPFIGDRLDAVCTLQKKVDGKDVPPSGTGYLSYLFGGLSYLDNNYYTPSSLKTLKVSLTTRIASGAFYNCKSLVSVNVSDLVKEIGERAFFGCTSLTSLSSFNSLGITSLTTIGASAFASTRLAKVYIPYSVNSIGSHAFASCSDAEFYVQQYSTRPTGWDPDWNPLLRPVTWNYIGK